MWDYMYSLDMRSAMWTSSTRLSTSMAHYLISTVSSYTKRRWWSGSRTTRASTGQSSATDVPIRTWKRCAVPIFSTSRWLAGVVCGTNATSSDGMYPSTLICVPASVVEVQIPTIKGKARKWLYTTESCKMTLDFYLPISH